MTKIDDEMLDRALQSKGWTSGAGFNTGRDVMRNILEAALSPKPEPEIEVTEGMTQVGLNAFHRDWTPKWTNPQRHGAMAKAYRAANINQTPQELDDIEAYALSAFWGCEKPHNDWNDRERWNMARALYVMARAKLALEGAAYAAKSALQGASAGAPVKETGGGVGGTHGRSGDIGYTFHRRKDDPKPKQFYGMNRD